MQCRPNMLELSPWEEPLGSLDGVIALPPIPFTHDLPREPAIGPGLQPGPAAQPAAAAPAAPAAQAGPSAH